LRWNDAMILHAKNLPYRSNINYGWNNTLDRYAPDLNVDMIRYAENQLGYKSMEDLVFLSSNQKFLQKFFEIDEKFFFPILGKYPQIVSVISKQMNQKFKEKCLQTNPKCLQYIPKEFGDL